MWGILYLLVMFGPPLAWAIFYHNDQEKARRLGPYGGPANFPIRYDVLPQDDPPVTAPFFGCQGDTGS